MAVDMYHHNAIAEALRRVLRGASPLVEGVVSGDTVSVLCGRVFAPGQVVRLVDDTGQSEEHLVAEIIGDEVRLSEEIEGSFSLEGGARLQAVGGLTAELKWVAQGRPELIPAPQWSQLPAVVVEPGTMEQPANAGTNRTYQQEYNLHVYYVRRAAEGEEANVALLNEVAALVNLIMSDPYLGGTCWHSQVTRVDTRPREEAELCRRAPGVSVVRLDVLAERSEVWG